MDDDELLTLLGADPILGARVLSRSRTATAKRIAANRSALRRALVPATPGVPKPGGRNVPLGFTPIQLTGTAVAGNLQARTQVPFRGQRLVLAIVRSAAGVGGLITVTSLWVGTKNMLASAQPIIADAFDVDATYVQLDIDPATPGIDVVIGIGLSAAPGVGTVDIGATLFGLSVG